MNSDEIEVFSADAKDKLRLGGPVVSRHIKVRSYSLIRITRASLTMTSLQHRVTVATKSIYQMDI